MANPPGIFDPTIVAPAWFDETIVAVGWFDPDLVQSSGSSTAYTLTAAQGSYTLTGQSAVLNVGRVLTAAQGAYTLTGQDVLLKVGRVLVAEQGAYTVTGQDATLTFTPAGSTAYSMTADQGSFALTGIDAALTFSGVTAAVSVAGGVKKKNHEQDFFVAHHAFRGNKTTNMRQTWKLQIRAGGASQCRNTRHCKQSKRMFRSYLLGKYPFRSLAFQTLQSLN